MTDTDQTSHDRRFADHLERVAMQPLLDDAASIAVDVNDLRLAIETIRRLSAKR